MRLIDADALEDRCNNYLWDDNEYEHITSFIADEPTIEVELVKHGTWSEPFLYKDNEGFQSIGQKCSVCGSMERPLARHNFCPHCGAKMDGGEPK